MSKKDFRRTRDSQNEYREDFDLQEHHFDEITDSFTASVDEMTGALEKSLSANREDGPLVDDSDEEEDEEAGPSILVSIGTFLRGVPRVVFRFFRSLGSATVSLGRRIGSCFVLRLNDPDEEDETLDDSVPTKGEIKGELKTTKSEEMFLEEDEGTEHWNFFGFGAKIATLAAAVLLVVGGFFGMRTLLSGSEKSTASKVAEPSNEIAMASDASDPSDTSREQVPEKPRKSEKKEEPEKKTPNPQAAANALKSSETKKPEPDNMKSKPSAPPPPKTASPKKPEPKANESKKAAVREKAPVDLAENAKPSDAKPSDPVKKTSDPKVKPKAAVASAPAASDPAAGSFDINPAPQGSAAPTDPFAATFESSFAAGDAKSESKSEEKNDGKSNAALPVPAADPWGGVFAAAPTAPLPVLPETGAFAADPIAPNVPAPPLPETASAFPDAPLKAPEESALSPASVIPTDLPPLSVVPSAPTPDQAATTAGAPVGLPPLNPLNSPIPEVDTPATSLQPLKPEPTSTFAAASTVAPVDSSPRKFPADEFSMVPTPPKNELPVPSLELDDSVRPMNTEPKPEIVPAIPSMGHAQPIINSHQPQPVFTSVEPSPGIPADGAVGRSVSFTAPSPRTEIASPPTPASGSAQYVPPLAASGAVSGMASGTTSGPAIQPLSAASLSSPPVRETASAPSGATGGGIGIPSESRLAPVGAALTASAATVGVLAAEAVPSMSLPVAPSHPEHERLAATDPPLGSQLQNQVQELRNQETVTPQLKFNRSEVSATSGAVRFRSRGGETVVPSQNPLPVPEQPNDAASNPLYRLNPTGDTSQGTVFNAASLPSAETAPQPILAESNPGYRRSIRSDMPAATTVAPSAEEGVSGRARLFRSQVDEEIKRSPSNAEAYTVQAGDTYMTICDRFFGTSLLYRALAVHNRKRGAAWIPTAGTVIEIPTAEYLKEHYADVLSRGGRSQRSGSSSGGSGSLLRQGTRYTVQEGDSVFKIATNQLRDSSRWREIVEMNSDRIGDPKDLRPGTELVLPVAGTASSVSTTGFGRR